MVRDGVVYVQSVPGDPLTDFLPLVALEDLLVVEVPR